MCCRLGKRRLAASGEHILNGHDQMGRGGWTLKSSSQCNYGQNPIDPYFSLNVSAHLERLTGLCRQRILMLFHFSVCARTGLRTRASALVAATRATLCAPSTAPGCSQQRVLASHLSTVPQKNDTVVACIAAARPHASSLLCLARTQTVSRHLHTSGMFRVYPHSLFRSLSPFLFFPTNECMKVCVCVCVCVCVSVRRSL